jgi:hypothetical protein
LRRDRVFTFSVVVVAAAEATSSAMTTNVD